jgi:adenylate cyclase
VTLIEERRLVTVLFADLVGFTGRADASDPELVREMQRAYFSAVSGQVERYGGVVEKYIGDAVMAIFGVPQAHDDDAERALHAARGIREAIDGLGWDLEIRIGVNTGEVVGGAGAGRHGDEYTVTGDAVNVAARLEQAANPGEIFVGAVTRRLAFDGFEFAPLSGLELKGKEEPVEAWRLVGALPERLRVRTGEAPLVGRVRELAALDAAIEEAAGGRGLLVALVGEAGIGKSRLALELRVRAEREGLASLWAMARPYASAFPYHVVSQLAEGLLGRRGGSVEEALTSLGAGPDASSIQRWAAVLADVLGEKLDDPVLAEITPLGRQHLLVQVISALLVARCRAQPQLIVLDDLQWADAASMAVIDELVELVPDLPLLLSALYRSDWSHGWSGKSFYQQMNLGPLRTDDALLLSRDLARGRALPDDLAQRILERSAGNPFFLEELLRAETGTDRGQHASRLPETLHEVLLARIDALPPAARQILQLAATVGMEFSQGIVAGIEPRDDLPDQLRFLQQHDLVVARPERAGDRSFSFRHPLIYEVAYRSLLLTRRRELHGRIAQWLEANAGEESLPAIATHYHDSDDLDKAREYLPRAAERAASLNALREALTFYLQAADLLRDEPPRRARMLEQAARQHYLLGDTETAIGVLEDAVRLYWEAGEQLRALDCRRWLGRYFWLDGRGAEAEAEITGAIEGLEQLPVSRELALAYSFRAQARMLIPDYEGGVEWARKAIEIAEPIGATDALVHAYNNLGLSLWGLGDPAGIDYIRTSLAMAIEDNIPDEAGRAYVNQIGQGIALQPLPYAEAEALVDEAVGYAQRTQPGGTYDNWIQNARGEFLFFAARWDEAQRQFQELLARTRANRYIQINIIAFRALLAALRGQPESAAELVSTVVEPAIRIGDLQAYAPVLLAQSHARAGLTDVAGALGALKRAIALRGDRHEPNISCWLLFESADVVTSLALAVGDTGDPSEAIEHGVRLLAAYATGIAPDASIGGTPAELLVRRGLYGAAVEQLAVLADGLGQAAAVETGGTSFPGREESAQRFDSAHRLFDAARARLWLAEEQGDPRLLGDARSVFERLDATGYVRRAQRLAARFHDPA